MEVPFSGVTWKMEGNNKMGENCENDVGNAIMMHEFVGAGDNNDSSGALSSLKHNNKLNEGEGKSRSNISRAFVDCNERNTESSENRREVDMNDRKGSRHRSETNGCRKDRMKSRSRSRAGDRKKLLHRDNRESRRHERHRKREKSDTDTSYSCSRSRSRSNSSDARRTSSRRRNRRHRSCSRTSDASSNGGRRNQKSQYESYQYQEPNNTIMVRGLAPHLNENHLRQDVVQSGIMVKDIRLIRHRETGESRGFAFVEFNSVADAVRWMDIKKGVIVIHGQYQANLIYSIPKISNSEGMLRLMIDWVCETCRSHNFKRREYCYKCNSPRPEESDVNLQSEVSSRPTCTIILSNLDTLTTEDGVLQAFKSKPDLASIPIKAVKIARESDTCLSRGICYVEANNISEASLLFTVLNEEVLEIDKRIVSIAYGKTTNLALLLKNYNTATAAVAAAQWTNNSSCMSLITAEPESKTRTAADIKKMAQYSAQLYAKTSEEYTSYLDYYRTYYKQEDSPANEQLHLSKSDKFPSSQSDHQSNLYNVKHIKAATGTQAPLAWTGNEDYSQPQQGLLDTSRYLYDSTSGYYFDPVSGLYYDATTQYFYDSEKQQFLLYSQHDKKYIVMSGNPVEGASDEGKKEKHDEVKVAKRIAKEMEKWAKSLNQKKDIAKQPTVSNVSYLRTNNHPVVASCSTPGSLSHSPPNGSTPIYKNCSQQRTQSNTGSFEVDARNKRFRFEQEYNDSRDDLRNELDPNASSIIDEVKIACILCKRRFSNKDVLQRHVQMSELHKKNLEALRQDPVSTTSESSSSLTAVSYRDRAKERRNTVGSGMDVSKNLLKNLYLQSKLDLNSKCLDEPNKNGIDGNNIGNQMLQKMGWQVGKGLGADNQGRVDIITVEPRAGKFGLGIRAPEVTDKKLDPQAKARKITMARYQEYL